MDQAFQRLFIRAQPLGNPARKHLRIVERKGRELLEALERSGRLSLVHIDRTAPSLAADFDHVAASAVAPADILSLIGTFYSIQVLHMNARSLERLAQDLAEQSDRRLSYARFLRRTEDEFFGLLSTYMRRVLRYVHPGLVKIPYLVCAVGTRSHQDDVDVLVLDEGGRTREELDHAVARLSNQMLRYSVPLDNYVAEHLGAKGFCLSPEELHETLRTGRLNFVVVTELLWAQRMAGSRKLFNRLRQEVTSEYFYRPGRDNSRHEHYLRGLLGESRSLLLRPPHPGTVHPKDEGLRVIRSLTTALKIIMGFESTRPGDLLRLLQGRRPGLRVELRKLEDSLVFLETFFHLSQVLVSLEEQIEVEGEAARENLRRLTTAMGYRDRGSLNAIDHMLTHYYEAVDAAHEAAVPIMEEVAHHLAGTSRFARWTRGSVPEEDAPDLAVEFAVGARAFRGARFWDDVLEALAVPDGVLLDTFARSFSRLPDARRQRLASQYAEWGRSAPYSLLTLLVLLAAKGWTSEDPDPRTEITAEFLEGLGERAENVRSIARVFRYYPDLMNRFLLTLEERQLDRFRSALDVAIGDAEVATARDRLDSLIHVHGETSRYVKRVLARLTVRHPATVLALRSDASLRTLALGRLAASERHPNLQEQKGLLGDYYDMEFLRVAMGTLRGQPIAKTRSEFAELTRAYLSGLLDACIREAEVESGSRLFNRDRLGIYLTGGNARGRPYDEDYDLLVLLDSKDPDERRLAERGIAFMNRQIARRGVVAQYRLGDRLGHFVTQLDELVDLMKTEEEDLFVDRCQVLASHLIVGSRRVEESLVERVIRPILERRGEFIVRVRQEILERRRAFPSVPENTLHLKEMPGGLRDIDLCLVALIAGLGLREHPGEGIFTSMIRLDPARGGLFGSIRDAAGFLVALRSAYRVSVVASDVVERDYLDSPARILGYEDRDGMKRKDLLFHDIRRRMEQAADVVIKLTETSGLVPS
jgi:hypothetical protein